MEIRVLGPLEAHAAGRLDLGPAKQRLVLAALLLDAGTVLPTGTLVDRVWGDDPPDQVRSALYSYLTRIRGALRRAGAQGPVIHREAGGYRLELDPQVVDLFRFRRLVRSAESDEDRQARAVALREAVQLWKGIPLDGLDGPWVDAVRQALEQERLAAVLLWSRTERELGRPGETVPVLQAAAEQHPLVEPLLVELLTALAGAGRVPEALTWFDRTRRRLDEELGVTPGPQLRDLHVRLLQGWLPDRPAAGAVPEVAVRRLVGPAQLPSDVRGFTGRSPQLAALDGLLAPDAEPGVAVISAVSGGAGVGKTALTVHWAHRVAGRFADGQLFVNLRGFDPAGPPMDPSDALRSFLDALGVPGDRIPPALDARAALYRSLLAGRRFLILLDNARDAEQVRPLLPGSPGCLTLVTSRDRLTGLVAGEGAHPLAVPLPSPAEALDLLSRRIGAARASGEPFAVREIVARCARLPLALAVVGARAAIDPELSLTDLAGQLRAAPSALEALGGSDPATDVRAVLSWSYRQLGPDAARLFRLLGLHHGPDCSAAAAASLAGIEPARAARLLVTLRDANLLLEPAPGRYALHDLLRAYAAEQAQLAEAETDRDAAAGRLLEHYLHTAVAGDQLLLPFRDGIDLAAAQPGTSPEPLPDREAATAWFDTEYQVLLTAVRRAGEDGRARPGWQLAWSLSTYLGWRGDRQDWIAALDTGLQLARQLGDLAAQAVLSRLLGYALARADRLEEAGRQFRQARDLYRRDGDRPGEAFALNGLAMVSGRQGDNAGALAYSEQALPLFQATGHQQGEANTLNNIGWYALQLGDPRRAAQLCRQALACYQRMGNLGSQAHVWDTLANVHRRLGEPDLAVAAYRQAIALFRQTGDRFTEAETWSSLAEAELAAGDRAAAARSWQQALQLLEELGHPDAAAVRARLDSGASRSA